jgi:adenylate cyclase
MSAELPPSLVDLAREADFQVARLAVRPSRRELVAGGERSIIEPRVMQVLVALARSRGEVVSRDDLIATCWDGRIVGDDAINACVAKVRRVGEASGAYEIETVPRVGYRLLTIGAAPDALSAAPTRGAEVVLAVLPFENLSGDPDLGYFSDGVSEEILNALAQRTDLKVIGRSSSFQFRGADKAIPNVARQLGVTHVLDGAVRRSGERTRISAQLIDCASQATVWSDRIERELADIFALQDQVAVAVTQAMRCAFTATDARAAVDPVAYDLYLRGSAQPTESIKAQVQPKVRLLEEATSLAPTFADAWARLGFARGLLAPLLPELEAQAMRVAARDAAQRALDLESRNAQAALAMARAQPALGSFVAQDAWIKRALEWAPNDITARTMEAMFLESTGQLNLAVDRLRHCVRLDPLDYAAGALLATALGWAGELDEAAERGDEVLKRWPEFVNSAAIVAQLATWRGDFDRARLIAANYDLGSFEASIRGMIEIRSDASKASHQLVITMLRRQFATTGQARLDLVAFAAHLGDAGEALDIALKADFSPLKSDDSRNSEVFYLPMLFWKNAPEVRRDVRFVQLCARLGLVDYWLATDHWPDCVEAVAPYYDFRAECRRVGIGAPASG